MRSAPTLKVNRSFMSALMHEDAPCLAPAIVEIEGARCALFALRLSERIPRSMSGADFEFGHVLLGTKTWEVAHFVFAFYGFLTFHALLNPSNPIVQKVLHLMIETGNYMFFALDSDQAALGFRASIDRESVAGLRANLTRLRKSRTTEAQYRSALARFSKDPQPPGQVLSWVCRHELDALYPQHAPLVLRST